MADGVAVIDDQAIEEEAQVYDEELKSVGLYGLSCPHLIMCSSMFYCLCLPNFLHHM